VRPVSALIALSALNLCAQEALPPHLLPAKLPAPPKPLPDAQGLIARVLEKAKAVGRLAESYTYQEEETEQRLDGSGRVKHSIRKTYEVIHVPKGKVRRLVAKDGQPLSPAEREAEESRVQERLKAILAPPDPAKTPTKGREINLSLQDVLAVAEFGPVGRAEHKGQAVLAIAFQPRKGSSSTGLGQRVFGKLEGRILVDEATEQVVFAEARLLESAWVGGGLLGALVPPTAFTFEQARVAENLWMPIEGNFQLHARITFVPLRMNLNFRCHDFQKFVVEDPTLAKAR